MKATTLIFGGLGVLGIGALVFWGFGSDPVPVDLAEITQGEMRVTVNADGKTRIRDVYEVSAPIAGEAQRSPVRVGDRVIADRTVVAVVRPVTPALLDSRSRAEAEAAVTEAEAALDVAISRVRQAQEDLSYAQSQYTRVAELVRRGVAALSRLEDAAQMQAVRQAGLEAARSQQAMADAALARARAVLIEPDPETPGNGSCCIALHAPVDGVVLSVAGQSERPVSAGTPLLTIGDPRDLEIVADFLSADAVRIAPGSRALVERWGGETALEAILRRVEPSARTRVSALGIEEQRVDVVFDLISPPELRAGLGNGFAVFVRVVEWQGDAVLRVPLSALFRQGDQWMVFREADGVARRVAVQVGRRNDVFAEVTGGLAAGDLVILHPGDRVADGVAIISRSALD